MNSSLASKNNQSKVLSSETRKIDSLKSNCLVKQQGKIINDAKLTELQKDLRKTAKTG